MTFSQLLSYGIRLLSHLSSPELDARILLQHACSKSFEDLIAYEDQEIDQVFEQQFFSLLERRKNLEPVAYITGSKAFFDLEFEVSKDVLIPRSDSEILVDYVLKDFAQEDLKILDLGTGSGCLIITLLKHLPQTEGIGVDASHKALDIAKRNADKIGVGDRLTLLQSNWFSEITPQAFDIIISNPPYIGLEEDISPEVRCEPHTALFAGLDGLDSYKQIAAKAKDYLSPQGSIYLETGYKQKEDVQKIFEAHTFKLEGIAKDLQGHARCLKFRLCV
ncbi:bifunctional N5-glutamine S-adenosyl-L-methionine-dependent methyltransferase/tRNA [Candidatus Phycorickettsia trachydisci]|uniref:Release factor glutamine methyltransferase n=1 Tax=Candidatus Phycorickettsia trachydisci TaxID=2115978 RepID=A0A2P1P8P1_9RICK|nr:peptide chain release factor N(5)-glutamine methyltransferase [Candidatus Phycorickettsia trachydisci]AVP87627.1 bifunctional N5-glutamine S-adenosyl-L-methionine-dependent methyltransferase/tRNA [Candidatus Phycorickettsia trachydisci]